jgi:peptidoglycan glycosyltransferase
MVWLILKLLVLGSLLGFTVRAVRTPARYPPSRPPHARPILAVAFGLLGLFTLTLAYQANWHLAADQDPRFARVSRLDGRPWAREKAIPRGRVFDRKGRLLIANGPNGQRQYPLGPQAAHVTGYHHRRYDKAGIEAACDDVLLGWRRPTWAQFQDEWKSFTRPRLKPTDVLLTLDAHLQRVAAEALGARSGAVVALDPTRGQILVLCSQPAFDPNRMAVPGYFESLKEDDRNPFLNRALQGLYPPGSVFKLIVAAAALENGITPQDTYACPAAGYLPPGGDKPILDYEAARAARQGRRWKGHGSLTLTAALRRSANTYFAQLGVYLGSEVMAWYAEQFGFGQTLALVEGRGRPSALAARLGFVNAPRPLPPREAARLAIGQGPVVATPLGMALVTAAIAHEGVIMRPRLLLDDPPEVWRQPLPPQTARRIGAMMAGVVAAPDGTGHQARVAGLSVAGKTGSAENPQGPAHAWFVAFAPVESPKLVVTVVVAHGGSGGSVAAPIARRILEEARKAGYL